MVEGLLFAVLVASGSGQPAETAEVVGPAAALVRPPERPEQVRRLKLPASVNRRWLQDDCDLFWSIRHALPPDPTRDDLVGLRDDHSRVEEADLGLGLRRRRHVVGAGYFSCHITTVTVEKAPVSMRVSCWGHLAKPERTRPIVQRALGDGFSRVEGQVSDGYERYEAVYRFPRAERRARALLDTRLGALASVAVPPELASAYARLMSPEEDLAVGSLCGEGATPPAGAKEAKALLAARRPDLLRNVLRGPNPEARVYALRALRKLGPLSPEDRTASDRVTALPIQIQNCNGCIYGMGTISDALRAGEP